LKILLLKNNISSSSSGNCALMDRTRTESVFEIYWAKRKLENSKNEDVNKHLIDLNLDDESSCVLKDNVLYYIYGFTVKIIFKKIECQSYRQSFRSSNNT